VADVHRMNGISYPSWKGCTAAMTRKTTSPQLTATPVRGRARSAREIEDVIRTTVPSDDPVVVLSSLARSSNPSFSDACAVELSQGADDLFQVSFPMRDEAAIPASVQSPPAGTSEPPAAGKTVTTAFQAGSSHGYPAFAGVVVHSWVERDPTEDDAIIARLLVELALAIVHAERLSQSAVRADDRAAKLAIELITSRVEGEAIGILMAKHQATKEEAASLLRRMSRASRRELHDVAADVVCTGNLQPLLKGYAGSRARRDHLQIAASDGQTITKTVRGPADRPGA
jgi:ANTAR domain